MSAEWLLAIRFRGPCGTRCTRCRPIFRSSGPALRLKPEYGPFAAARDRSGPAQAALAETLESADDFVWLVEPEAWPAPPGTSAKCLASVVQLAGDPARRCGRRDEAAVLLRPADVPAMTALAEATRPGPWGPATHLYGDYFGIKGTAGDLLAMAGVRFRPAAGFVEISGVCTWPQWRGRGFAERLVRHVIAVLEARGELPFLHAYADNRAAVTLYERLGFVHRNQLVVTELRRS